MSATSLPAASNAARNRGAGRLGSECCGSSSSRKEPSEGTHSCEGEIVEFEGEKVPTGFARQQDETETIASFSLVAISVSRDI
jgi:hypothetical protein